jgi:hydroxyacylglutathione hydrolase
VSDAPQALFSGDMLFVGEVGRPDLLGEAYTSQLIDQLYDSIYERLMPLDDSVVVYPGHGAGSACGKKIGDQPSTTIGQEKRFNYAFRAPDREAFRRAIFDGMPPAPSYYPVMKRVNKVGPRLLRELPGGSALSAADIAARIEGPALVIDARTPDAFSAGHIPGALFAGLGSNFTAWMGWLAPYDREIILVLNRDADYAEALTELRRIGLDQVAGYLDGGMCAWRDAGYETRTLSQMSVENLRDHRAAHDIGILDVRSLDEWQSGHIPGANHRYAADIIRGMDEISTTDRLAVICASGYRSTVAASVLQRQGYDNLVNVRGGMDAWQDAEFETTTA